MHSDAGTWEKHLCVFLLRMENNNNHWVFAGICTPLRKTSLTQRAELVYCLLPVMSAHAAFQLSLLK